MQSQCHATVSHVVDIDGDMQEILAVDSAGVERRAVNYTALCAPLRLHDVVTLNTTATGLRLGTGGFDFVVAAQGAEAAVLKPGPGHIIKARYLPCQVAVDTLEEQPEHADVWLRDLERTPVLAAQLHSQLVPIAYGIRSQRNARIAYIMTDGAALPIAFSKTVREAKLRGLIDASLTCGQAFGGDYECVTLHSALLAARHVAGCDTVIVCQGPGNAGTGTPYGFSGIEQAGILDATERLGGIPMAVARMSSGDLRERHQGISHHTRTTLSLTYARCIVGVPAGIDAAAVPDRHEIRFCDGTAEVLDQMGSDNWNITTMGRAAAADRLFFEAALAAGMIAARL